MQPAVPVLSHKYAASTVPVDAHPGQGSYSDEDVNGELADHCVLLMHVAAESLASLRLSGVCHTVLPGDYSPIYIVRYTNSPLQWP
jgi:hypothetical protein